MFHFFENFEYLEVYLRSGCNTVTVFIVNKPSGYATLRFVNEFEALLLQAQNYNMKKIYVGDFNIWIDNSSKTDAGNFTAAPKNFKNENYIHYPT